MAKNEIIQLAHYIARNQCIRFRAEKIQERIDEINQKWESLIELWYLISIIY